MMKKKYVLLAATAVLISVGCHKKMYSGGNKSASSSATEKKTYTDVQLTHGKTIVSDHCDKCHELHAPSEFTVKEWGDILPSMVKKAELTEEQATLVTAWINANAKAG